MMKKRLLSSRLFIVAALSLLSGCTSGPGPALAPPLPTITSLPPTDTPTPMPPSATSTLPPTATPTTAPPTSTPTRTPPPITSTPKPTQPPPRTPPTAPSSAPRVDVVAAIGQETCVSKFVNAPFLWEELSDDRRIYAWDKTWSLYPADARPSIKTARPVCDEQNQCWGLVADFCVFVNAGAVSGVTYESVVHLVIYSAFSDGSGQHVLSEVDIPFRWLIK